MNIPLTFIVFGQKRYCTNSFTSGLAQQRFMEPLPPPTLILQTIFFIPFLPSALEICLVWPGSATAGKTIKCQVRQFCIFYLQCSATTYLLLPVTTWAKMNGTSVELLRHKYTLQRKEGR